MAYRADPGGWFASDVHRRVLGNLTYHTDNYGWSVPALFERLRPDRGTEFDNPDELQTVLTELEKDGYAQAVEINGQNIWRMTEQGHDLLTGSIKDEPPPGATVQGPAMINAPGVAAATRIDGEEGPAGDERGLAEAENTEFIEDSPAPGDPGPAEGSTVVPTPPTADPQGGLQ